MWMVLLIKCRVVKGPPLLSIASEVALLAVLDTPLDAAKGELYQ